MELRTSLYSRDVMWGFVLKWRLSVLDINCQLCLTWLIIMKTYGLWKHKWGFQYVDEIDKIIWNGYLFGCKNSWHYWWTPPTLIVNCYRTAFPDDTIQLVPGWWGGDPADGCRVLTSLVFPDCDIDILNQYRDVVADDVGETDCSTKE